MRADASNATLTVRAVAGTRGVVLAMRLAAAAQPGILGFAIYRTGPDGVRRALEGTKVFRSVLPAPIPGERHPSDHHPFQALVWNDQSVTPGTPYTYTVQPLYGAPAAPVPGPAVDVRLRTEHPDEGTHGVWFNRGAVASQGYAAAFGNRAPEDPADPQDRAVRYLSHGLLEAALAFIGRAQAPDRLHVAAYEFTYPPILRALREAAARGVKVSVVYEDGEGDEGGLTQATVGNRAAIAAHLPADTPNLTLTPRRNREGIPHNKFIVWVHHDIAREVWTGSTNFTSSGFLGQSNVGHVVRDERVAAAFLAYWERLRQDPQPSALKKGNKAATPELALTDALPQPGTTTFFSPRFNTGMLGWYAARIRDARDVVMFTAAFGVSPRLAPDLGAPGDTTRLLLLEKPLTPTEKAHLLGKPNVSTAAGAILGVKRIVEEDTGLPRWVPLHDLALDRWFLAEDLYRHEGHVFFVHTKLLLLDPLSDSPLVCSGSANFSASSLEKNDENMLLIRGDTRVADIYVTEFDRLLRQFHVRESMNARILAKQSIEGATFLAEDASWLAEETAPGSFSANRWRVYFR